MQLNRVRKHRNFKENDNTTLWFLTFNISTCPSKSIYHDDSPGSATGRWYILQQGDGLCKDYLGDLEKVSNFPDLNNR